LPESERERMEARFLHEPDLLEEAAALEAELADADARGELPPERAAAWQARLDASARMRGRADFARTLADAAARASTGPRAATGWLQRLQALLTFDAGLRAAVAAALLLALGAAVWTMARRGPAVPREARGLEPPRTSPTPEAAAPSPRAAAPSMVTLALGLAPIRGAGAAPHLAVPAQIDAVRLEADLEGVETYRSFRAVLATDRGAEVFRQDALVPAPSRGIGTVAVTVPRRVLSPGRYVLTLEGRVGESWETAAVHEFRIDAR